VTRSEWPESGGPSPDTPDKLSLATTIQRIGQRLFGEAWKATDPTQFAAEAPLPLSQTEAGYNERQRARQLLQTKYPKMELSPYQPPSKHHGPGKNHVTEDEWLLAYEIDADQRDAANRSRVVRRFIQENCLAGKLAGYVQDSNGIFHSLHHRAWATARAEVWLTIGKLSSLEAFGGWNTNEIPRHWLFFSAEDLQSIATHEGGPSMKVRTHAGGQTKFREFLRAEIDRSPKRKTLKKKEIEHRAASLGLSGRMADRIRTEVIRAFPEDVQAVWTRAGAPSKKITSG
jgi:hypothetical protein